MYRYAHTRNRVHRVIVEGGKAFKVEQCNLDDVGFLKLDDVEPPGVHCAYCWAGWVEPTPEQAAAEAAAAAAAPAADAIPPGAKPIALVQSTRRMALGALAAAALLGGAAGVLASGGDPVAQASDLLPAAAQRQLDDLVVQVNVLRLDVDRLARLPSVVVPAPAPITVVLPPSQPVAPTAAPVPTAAPSAPPAPTAAPTASPAANRGGSSRATTATTRRTTNTSTTVIINVPPPPTAAPQPTPTPTGGPGPTPAPTPRACRKPGVSAGFGDRCRWPHN